jgi:threonine dehydrogenase-like Zn-dependent dehydrogenase
MKARVCTAEVNKVALNDFPTPIIAVPCYAIVKVTWTTYAASTCTS